MTDEKIIVTGTWIGIGESGKPTLEAWAPGIGMIVLELTPDATESLIVGATAPLLPKNREAAE